jgi:predicted transposase YbfD/YdcC
MMHDYDIEEIKDSFEDFCQGIKDPRIQRNQLHSLNELMFLILCAVIANCDGWRGIERFGRDKEDFLKRFYEYKNGIPSDDTIRRLMRRIHPTYFRSLLENWLKDRDFQERLHVAIDGKVSRSSADGSGNPLYTVSAYASESRLVIGQEKVASKTNEITAIPKLLKHVDVKDAIITIDAIGCQESIAKDIQEVDADYILCLKANQPSFLEKVEEVFLNNTGIKFFSYSKAETSHGREEKRSYRVTLCPEEIQKTHPWSGLKSLIEVTRERTLKGETSKEVIYYISSLEPKVQTIAKCIRSHWAIENSLHWVLDVVFKDDESLIRKGNAPANMGVVKKVALNLLQKSKGPRDSIKGLRESAGRNDGLMLKILKCVP